MTLLYLLEDDFAIDDDGVGWAQAPGGTWQPTVERRRPELRLVWSAGGQPTAIAPRGPEPSDGPRLASA